MLKNLKVLAIAITAATIISCSNSDTPKTKQANRVVIDIAEVSEYPVSDWYTYTTRLVSSKKVELRPRVTGFIESVEFEEGSFVNKGDTLFTLDNRTFLAEVTNIEAQVSRVRSALAQAKNESDRVVKLRERNAISAEEAEARSSLTEQRKAELAALNASLSAAKLKLSFAEIKAPISGTISYAAATEGNTVKENETILTTIVSKDKLYAYFDIDERTWNKNFSSVKSTSYIPVKIEVLSDTNTNITVGHLDFIDNRINERTGTLKVRAAFNNSKNILLPGAFARVKLSPGSYKEKIIIPDRAVGTDLKSRYVLIVDDTNTLQYRQVTLGKRYGAYRAITSGINQGDKIAVNGPAKVGPGMSISPKIVTISLPESLTNAGLSLLTSS